MALPQSTNPYEKRNVEYDAKWRKVKHTTQRPYPNNNSPMGNNAQQTFAYDNNDNEILQLLFRWNNTSKQWDTSNRYTSTYDANNNILMLNQENYYKPNGYRGSLRRNYEYDAKNNMTLYWTESWVVSKTAYDTFARQVFSYDANGNNDTILFQNFNRTTRKWENQSKAYYSYTNGLQTKYFHQFWRNSAWLNSIFNETFYDAQKKVTHNNYNSWDAAKTAWKKDTRDSIVTVSTNPTVRDVIYSTWNASKSTYERTTKATQTLTSDDYTRFVVARTWDANTKTWILANNNDSSIYRYEQVNVGVNNINPNAPTVRLYPNPNSGNNINVQVTTTNSSPYTIAIYNLQGQLMSQQNVADGAVEKSIPIPHLSNGQYIMTVTTQEGKTTQQFAVIR